MVERRTKKKERLKAIWKIIRSIDDPWILWQVYRFVVNMTREDD